MELTDEQLNNVTGGGSGNIPAGGITYSTYETIYSGHYYAQSVDSKEVVWLYDDAGWGFCTYETLEIDLNTNTWVANRHSGQSDPPQPFHTLYPYVLNIKP